MSAHTEEQALAAAACYEEGATLDQVRTRFKCDFQSARDLVVQGGGEIRQTKAQASRDKARREKAERRGAQPGITRCASPGCAFRFEGTMVEGTQALQAHRADCAYERPPSTPHTRESLSRAPVSYMPSRA